MAALGIFGTSGHAREVHDIAHALDLRVVYIARDAAELAAWTRPDDVMLEDEVGRYADMQFTIGIGDTGVRRRLARRFGRTLRFTNLCHPSATFGRGQHDVLDGQTGIVVCAGVRFTNGIRVGSFTLFNQNATIAHDTIVDDFVTVSPGTNISGNVHLGTGCWIGAGAVVNQGTPHKKLAIGEDAVVGSGSVVIADCDPGGTYVGVPARRIK